MPEQSNGLDTWAIVEVMGHKKYAGYVTEQTFGAATLLRVDVPETEQPAAFGRPARTTPKYSKLVGIGSIYMITPCTEEIARKAAAVLENYNDPIPVSLPVERRLAAGTHGSPELDADAEKLRDLGADPGPTLEDLELDQGEYEVVEERA